MVEAAEEIPRDLYRELKRHAERIIKTNPRQRPENVKERIVREKKYKVYRLKGEDVAEFFYRPGTCDREYRVVALRKNLSVERGHHHIRPVRIQRIHRRMQRAHTVLQLLDEIFLIAPLIRLTDDLFDRHLEIVGEVEKVSNLVEEYVFAALD